MATTKPGAPAGQIGWAGGLVEPASDIDPLEAPITNPVVPESKRFAGTVDVPSAGPTSRPRELQRAGVPLRQLGRSCRSIPGTRRRPVRGQAPCRARRDWAGITASRPGRHRQSRWCSAPAHSGDAGAGNGDGRTPPCRGGAPVDRADLQFLPSTPTGTGIRFGYIVMEYVAGQRSNAARVRNCLSRRPSPTCWRSRRRYSDSIGLVYNDSAENIMLTEELLADRPKAVGSTRSATLNGTPGQAPPRSCGPVRRWPPTSTLWDARSRRLHAGPPTRNGQLCWMGYPKTTGAENLRLLWADMRRAIDP